MENINYKLLETQGYVVIPGFLNNKELEFFRKDYVNSKRNEYLVGYVLYDASSNAIQIIEKKIIELKPKKHKIDLKKIPTGIIKHISKYLINTDDFRFNK